MDLRDRIRPLFSTHGKLDVMSYGKYVLMAFLLFFANFLVGTVLFSGMAAALAALARISHRNGCIGAANQRKLLCHNDLTPTRGAPRCRQSVPRIFLDSHPLKDAM
jgi:hypothetical protein